ncbi:MAG: hypothetical protein VXY92_05990 [Planctomycetota bacterium]|nr:hypothetical protein [Planctomycetota bacterium]
MHNARTRAASVLLAACLASTSASSQSAPCLAENDLSSSVVNSIFGNYSTPRVYAWQITAPSNMVVQSGRIYTHNAYQSSVGSFMELEIWDEDPASPGQPGSRVAGGTWRMRNQVGWQGTNFDGPVALQANTPYWIALTEPGWSTPPVEPGGTQFPMMYQSGSSWVSMAPEALKFRLYCGLLDAAGVTTSGPGCPGSSGAVPAAFVNSSPSIPNSQLAIEGTGLGSGALVVHALGTIPSYPSVPIPGAPGCFLRTNLDVVAAATAGVGDIQSSTSPAGHARFPMPIPNNAALAGFVFTSQLAAFDLSLAAPLPIVTSNALQFSLF